MSNDKLNFYFELDKLPEYIPTKDLIQLFKTCIDSEPKSTDSVLLKSLGQNISIGYCHNYINRLDQLSNKTPLSKNLRDYFNSKNSELIFEVGERTYTELKDAFDDYNNIDSNTKILSLKFAGISYVMINGTEVKDISNYPLLANYKSVLNYQAASNSFKELRALISNDTNYKISVALTPKEKKRMLLDSLRKDNNIDISNERSF